MRAQSNRFFNIGPAAAILAAAFMALGGQLPAATPEDAGAGAWKMIVLSGPAQFTVSAPAAVTDATYQAELTTIKNAQARITDEQRAIIEYWSKGGALRWNEILLELVARADQLSATLGSSHPQMQSARSQVAGLRQEMEDELARIRQSMKGAMERAEANATALQRRLDALTASSLDTSEAGIKARQLQSEVEALRALYKTLLTRASELGQRDTVNINNSRVISKAVPGGGSSFMVKLIIIAAGAMFGVALGSGLAVLREIVARMMSGQGRAAGAAEPAG